jgi:hypothetical protein
VPWLVTPVEVANLETIQLAINYTSGKPGSYFAVTGSNIPPGGAVEVWVNGTQISQSLTAGSDGKISFRLSTFSAGNGRYAVTVRGTTSRSIGFSLSANAPLRPQQGAGPVFIVPAGLALTNPAYLPVLGR